MAREVSRALIVESDPHIRKLQEIVLRYNASITTIVERSSVEEALDIYGREKFDFAMIELSLKNDNLDEFLRVSRDDQRIPVIAFATAAISRDALKTLVDGYVFAVFAKSFDVHELIASVRAAVSAVKDGRLYPDSRRFADRIGKKM